MEVSYNADTPEPSVSIPIAHLAASTTDAAEAAPQRSPVRAKRSNAWNMAGKPRKLGLETVKTGDFNWKMLEISHV